MTAQLPDLPRTILGPVAARPVRWSLRRRHVLMLALAAEVLILGARGAERFKPAGITVEMPSTTGHVIT